MYAYNLLIHIPGSGYRSVTPEGTWTQNWPIHPKDWQTVRPGPDMEFVTLSGLRQQVRKDLGYVPDWLEAATPDIYLQEEDEHKVGDVWFLLDIEGSEDHELPPVAQRIAYRLNPEGIPNG